MVPPALRPFVAQLWVSDDAPAAGAAREHVLPTGALHLAIRLSEATVRLIDDDGRVLDLGHGVVGGPRARFYVKEVAGPARSIGAVLRPGAALPLLGHPAHVFAGRHVRLDDVWGPAAVALRDRLASARSPAEALARFAEALQGRLPRVRALHPAVAHAVARLDDGADLASVVAETGYSHRHVAGLFEAAVGLPPKRYARVRRLQRVLSAAGTRPWAELAAACGYSDQAHLVREFRELAGITPGQYRRLDPRHPNHVPIGSDSFKPGAAAGAILGP